MIHPPWPFRHDGFGEAHLYFTVLTALASLLLYLWIGFEVGKARVRCKVKAPATTGHPEFERFYRVQMNTLEWLVVYLPCLLLFGFYVSDLGAAALGIAWIAGRVIYKRAYVAAPETRGRGFVIQATATSVLLFGTALDVLFRLATGH
jgi:glutathione S-transferase